MRVVAGPEDVEPTDRVAVTLSAASDEDALVLLLEEVIYVAEVLGKIPVGVVARRRLMHRGPAQLSNADA